tara:strand:- start:527 stop:748 length:222 start_codon:yes stop_codon:yes gene_type:complete
MDAFANKDLGLDVPSNFDPIVVQVQVIATASQLGIEDDSGRGASTRFQREYPSSKHGYTIPEVQFPVRNQTGK